MGRWWNASHIAPERWPYSPLFGVGNPGGHDWVWKRFFKPGRALRDAEMYVGFQPRPRENEQFLPPGYYDQLMIGKPEWWIRRFIKGDMRALEGLVFPTFDDEVNVIEPFPVPANWRRVMGLDHGQRNPTAMQWYAVDMDGNLICYRDYEKAGPTIPEHAATIKRLERRAGFVEEVEYRVADPSIFNKNQASSGKWHSIAEEYDQCGIVFQPGDNAMMATLGRCNLLLWPDPSHRFPKWHPKAGQLGSPRVFFFTTCGRAVESISSWKWKEHRGVDMGEREEPSGVDDHHADVFRYVATSFPEPTVESLVLPKEWTPAERQIARKVSVGKELRRMARGEDTRGGDEYV
jgi:phage terminase large subunit